MPRESRSIHGKILLGEGISIEVARNLMETPAEWIIAEGRRGRLERIGWQGQTYARKIYSATSPPSFHPFVQLLPGVFRWRRARRSWRSMQLGKRKGVPLPVPVALEEQADRAILISSWIRGEPLHHWHARALQHNWKPADEFRFARWIGKELQRALAGGLATRDLSPYNVLVDGPPEGPWSFGIVDLDDSSIGSPPRRLQTLHSLAQIGHLPPTISRTLKWRAIDAFLEAGGSELVGDRRKAIEDLSENIKQLDQSKTKRQFQKGMTGALAGWGLDEKGLPLPFIGGRKGP
ncbi:MAG: phosphotransferase [Planctomycetota bacterium]